MPAGKACFLDGTVVLGNVTIEPDAVLIAGAADLRGNVTASEDSFVNLDESTVAARSR